VFPPLIEFTSLIMPSPSYYECGPKVYCIERYQTYQHEKLQHGVI